jgi:acetyltransferase-like isoleucine patch superfamily enzyme
MDIDRSRLQYYKLQWKRGLIRAFYRIVFHIAYFFSPSWALNSFFLTMPSELIVEILEEFGARIGSETVIMPPIHIHNMGKHRSDHFANLIIGSQCYIGPELFIDIQDQIIIEDQATISMRVSLITHMHVGLSPLRIHHFPATNRPIIIRQGAYIGACATVLMGVEVGECAAVGAGSVITKNVSAYSVVAGVPARFIRKLE